MSIVKETVVRSLPFTKQTGFRKALMQSVNAYFSDNNLRQRDAPAMYLKSAIVLAAYVAGFGLVVFSGASPAVTLLLYVAWALAAVGVGFNIMHDAIHGGYSDNMRVNKIMGLTGEMIGTSNFVWRQKHNVWHHTYTNIAGLDDDLETSGVLRLSPHDAWKPRFRWQHLYLPIVYGLTGFGYLLRDFQVFFTGKTDEHHVYPKMTRNDRATFVLGKVVFLSVTLLIPMLVLPWWLAVLGWIVHLFTISLTLAAIFQLAHVMEPAAFPEPSGDPLHIENEWAVHQVQTTVDFAQGNRALNWYCGGLNFQIEHHLFPHISHVYYPALSAIVRRTCEEFGVAYFAYPTWRQALASHFRVVRALGRRPTPEAPLAPVPTVAK